MPFSFERADRSVEAAIQRLSLEQIDLALSAIAVAVDKKSTEKAVHVLRKHCKRLRSLLTLVRPSFPRFNKENAAIRDAALKLSPLRDADVLVTTFDKTAERLADHLDAAAVDQFRGALTARAERLRAEVDPDKALALTGDGLKAIRLRVPHWRLKDEDFEAIAEGFGVIYKRARRDQDAVAEKPSAENFHEWRKQVKHHFYHLCVLRHVAPRVLDGQRELAKELAETLGDHHNIAVFLQMLSDEAESFEEADNVGAVRTVLQERQDRLGALAFSLGAELLSERPRGLEQRLERYWFNWRLSGGDGHGPRDRAQVLDAA